MIQTLSLLMIPILRLFTLFDPEGNIINVNSWLECVHYLKGGWYGSNQILSSMSEQYLSISLVFHSCCVYRVNYLSINKANEIN